jgi:hypothetical protein
MAIIALPAGAAGTMAIDDGCARRLGLDFWNVAGLRREIAQSEHQIALLDEEVAAIRRRMDRKDAIIGEVIEGRLRLRDAVDQFRRLGESWPRMWAIQRYYLRQAYPGRSDDECLARNVIERVHMCLHADPPRERAVVDRLEAEVGQDYSCWSGP